MYVVFIWFILFFFYLFWVDVRWMDLKEEGFHREDANWYMSIVLTVTLELIVYIIGVSLAVRAYFGIQYAIVKLVLRILII